MITPYHDETRNFDHGGNGTVPKGAYQDRLPPDSFGKTEGVKSGAALQDQDVRYTGVSTILMRGEFPTLTI